MDYDSNPIFSLNYAVEGGSIYMEYRNFTDSTNLIPINLSNFIIRNNEAIFSGGFLTFSGQTYLSLRLTI